jgi:hypothetical protein
MLKIITKLLEETNCIGDRLNIKICREKPASMTSQARFSQRKIVYNFKAIKRTSTQHTSISKSSSTYDACQHPPPNRPKSATLQVFTLFANEKKKPTPDQKQRKLGAYHRV